MESILSQRAPKCPICQDMFTHPKVLSCGHSFCLDCLKVMVPHGYPSTECILCSQLTEIPSKDVQELPTNYQLQDAMDMIKAALSSRRATSPEVNKATHQASGVSVAVTIATNDSAQSSQQQAVKINLQAKRSVNRIQGGWKSGSSGRGGHIQLGKGVGRIKINLPHTAAYGQELPPSQRPQMSVTQQTGQSRDSGNFVFQAPDVEVNERLPDEIELSEDKTYTLSNTDHAGESRIRLFSKFIPEDEATQIFVKLAKDVHWIRRRIKTDDGREYCQHSKTFCFEKYPCACIGRATESCKFNQWHPPIWDIKQRIESYTKMTFNSVQGSLYDNDKDGVQWHSDKDKPTNALISLGATRRFQLRNKHGKFATNPARGEYVIHLTNGSLLLMMGATQDDWQHRVPKEYHDRGPTIKLNFGTPAQNDCR